MIETQTKTGTVFHSMDTAAMRHRARILSDVLMERRRQIDLYGDQMNRALLLPGVAAKTMCSKYGLPSTTKAQSLCEYKAKDGTLTYGDILVEEVCEVMECGEDLAHMREELVQVAAVAVAWVESVDARMASAASSDTNIGGEHVEQRV